jgi:hypothetical protein
VSSKFASAVAAVMVTLLVAVPLSSVLYVLLGPLLAMPVHDLWPAVPAAHPVWLPTAYIRADFGLEYLTLLILAPIAGIVLPAWFLYEVTVANMEGLSDDRSSGLRRWFLVSAPVLALTTLAPGFVARSWEWVVTGMSVMFLFLVFSTYVFAGEPLGPSQRVRVHWRRQSTSRFRRYLGPGIMRALTLLLVLGAGLLALQCLAGMALELSAGGLIAKQSAERIACFGGYEVGFFAFVVGFTAWTRARSTAPAVPRLLLTGMLFLANVGPWIAMAIAGVITEDSSSSRVLAAPSPTFAFWMMDAVDNVPADRDAVLLAGGICAGGWALFGLGLLGAAAARTRKVVSAHHAALARVEEMLDAEDRAVQDAAAQPDQSPLVT